MALERRAIDAQQMLRGHASREAELQTTERRQLSEHLEQLSAQLERVKVLSTLGAVPWSDSETSSRRMRSESVRWHSAMPPMPVTACGWRKTMLLPRGRRLWLPRTLCSGKTRC
jgi:hypothetical protein